MQLTTEAVEEALSFFIKSIEGAAFSWRIICIEFRESESLQTQFFQKQCLQGLNDHFEKTECEIFWCPSKTFILVFFQGRALPIEKCMEGFLKSIEYVETCSSFDILDLSIDWEEFLLLVKNVFPPPIDSPTPKAPPPPPPQEKKEPEKPEAPPKGNLFSITLNPIKMALLHPARVARIKPLILLVEDDAFFQKLAKVSLDGHEIILAETARQALVYYQRHLPDIVFLDINLPDGNGLNILKDIVEADPHSYVLMLSADSQREKIMLALERGAKNFIGKPFTRKRLLDAMSDFITYKKQSKRSPQH